MRINPVTPSPQRSKTADVRKEVSTLLNQLLANAADVYSEAKQAHWKVKRPGFFSLHELFEKVLQEVLEHTDQIGERAGQLGYAVSSTVRQAAVTSILKE